MASLPGKIWNNGDLMMISWEKMMIYMGFNGFEMGFTWDVQVFN